MNVTEADFTRILDLAQQAGERIIAAGEQHAPIFFGARLAGNGKYQISPPALIENGCKADLVRVRNTINFLLSKRLIDVGVFACESWVAKQPSVGGRAALAANLADEPTAVSALVIMLYSRDTEHCVINPIDEGPPRKMVRGKLDPTGVVGSCRMSMHAV